MPRILGIDYGTRPRGRRPERPGPHHGLPGRGLRLPGPAHDARHYRELVKEDEVDRIVIGLPLHTERPRGPARRAHPNLRRLAGRVTGLPVYYFDERYTSVEAENRMIDAGLKRQTSGSASATSLRPDHAPGLPRRRLPRDRGEGGAAGGTPGGRLMTTLDHR